MIREARLSDVIIHLEDEVNREGGITKVINGNKITYNLVPTVIDIVITDNNEIIIKDLESLNHNISVEPKDFFRELVSLINTIMNRHKSSKREIQYA